MQQQQRDYKEIEEKLLKAGWKLVKIEQGEINMPKGQSFKFQTTTKVYQNPATKTYVVLSPVQQVQDNYDQLIQMLTSQSLQQQEHEHECHDPNCKEHHHAEQGNEDIQTLMEQGHVDEEKAKELLQQHGNVAEALTALQKQ